MPKPVEPVRVEPDEDYWQSCRDQHKERQDLLIIEDKEKHQKCGKDQSIRCQDSLIRTASLHRIHADIVVDCIHLMHFTAKSIKMEKYRNSLGKCLFRVVWCFQRH